MKGKMRRSISLLLVLAMAMSLLGGNAWAAEAAGADSTAPVAETSEPAEAMDSAKQEEPEQEPAEPVQEPEKEEKAAEKPAQEEEQPVQEQSEPMQEESSPVTMEDSGTCGENLTWKLEGTTLTISGSGDMEDYSSSVEAPWSELTFDTLIIQDNVTSIGADAFSKCTNLKSVTIPDSVKSIGVSAFWECENVNVYISSLSAWCEKTLDSWIGRTYNLYLNDELVTDLVIPNGVTSINAYSFNYCGSLTSVTIPDGVTSIGVCAFDDCKGLKRVMIPGSVKSIGRVAFCWCSSLADVTISEGVTMIDNAAFADCYSLTSITIPDSVKSIGERAFAECSNLESVTLPKGLTKIADQAFTETGLTSVIIPEGVTEIGWEAFGFCHGLTNVTLPTSLKKIDASAFVSCTSLKNVKLNDGLTNIGNGAFHYCSSLGSITIPNSVTKVENYAFGGCRSLAQVTVGGAEIEEKAFEKCNGLESVVFTNGAKRIYKGLFKDCTGLKRVVIPNTVTSIDDYAFSGCSALPSIVIPSSVTTIGIEAFWGCTNLASVTIPKSVKSIEARAFNFCENLKDVYYQGSKAEWQQISIGKNNKPLTTATIHYESANTTAKTGISNCQVSLNKSTYTYNGKAIEPVVTVKDLTSTQAAQADGPVVMASGKVLKKGKDYTVSYSDNVNAGKAKVTVTGKGNYTGKKTMTFTIQKAKNTITASKISKKASTASQYASLNAKAKGGAKLTYRSDNKAVTVSKAGKVTLAKKFVGTATITITAQESKNYKAATKKITFTVKLPAVKLSSAKSAEPGKLTVKWAKNVFATGYQVQYATSSKFTGAKTAKISKYQTVTSTLGGLTEGKKYYVRVRAYKTSGKTTVYSAWSSAKSAKVMVTPKPAAVKLSSVKSAKAGEMTVKWTKNGKIDGYQVQYALEESFKGAKTVTVKKASTTSTTIKKLTKDKKYYVRVRTYQKAGSKTYYSAWSASKNVTIKK